LGIREKESKVISRQKEKEETEAAIINRMEKEEREKRQGNDNIQEP
jgi:hypothetical protein